MRAARQAWRRLEPVHSMIYFVPEAPERYAALGLDARTAYFASRAAAFGRASAEVVIATFYNFNPDVVRAAIPAAWEKASPEQVLDARADAATAALRRGGVDRLPGLEETVSLARRAAEAAGRPRPGQAPLRGARGTALAGRADPAALVGADPPARVPRGRAHRRPHHGGRHPGRGPRPARGHRHHAQEVPDGDPRVARRGMGGDRREPPRARPARRRVPQPRGRGLPPGASRTAPTRSRSPPTPPWARRAASASPNWPAPSAGPSWTAASSASPSAPPEGLR
ncbi:hypothetical protein LUX73_10695 [Actinomadura madurae]|nr:hypothetical protein [Actinomadura madurae]MCQ0005104.1 hypothetical protein [Actinomadura madurae]